MTLAGAIADSEMRDALFNEDGGASALLPPRALSSPEGRVVFVF